MGMMGAGVNFIYMHKEKQRLRVITVLCFSTESYWQKKICAFQKSGVYSNHL